MRPERRLRLLFRLHCPEFPAQREEIAALGPPTAHDTTTATRDPTGPRKRLARRRRANAPGGRPHQHMVRVTDLEEAQLRLRADAENVTIPRLLIERALADGGEPPSERRDALVELFRVRRQLAGLATNVNQIAHAVNTDGRLPLGGAATVARMEDGLGKI